MVLAAICSVAACAGRKSGSAPDSGPRVDAGPPLVDVLTQHDDVARTGANMSEAILNTSNVNGSAFGKLFSVPVDGLIFAQPLYVSNYAVGGKTRNVMVIATAHNSVYAFDADAGGSYLWQTNLGLSVPSAVFPTRNILVEVGILSTPVIDRANGLIYVTNKTYFPDTKDPTCQDAIPNLQQFNLHVLSLATGADVPGSPTVISATVPGTGGRTGRMITLNACRTAQRPALLLLGGTVYMAFASHEDYTPFHGWVLGYHYDTTNQTLTQTQVLNLSSDGTGAGIWQGGQGLAADPDNNIYGIVSNGTTNVQDGGQSYGESFIKLSADLKVQDWYVPTNWAGLTSGDWDLGSGGPVVIPGAHMVAGGGKQGIVYLLDTDNMGKFTDNGSVQSFQGTNQQWNGIFGGPIFWNNAESPRYYIWGEGDVVRGYPFSNGHFGTTAVTSTVSAPGSVPGGADPVGTLAVSSNGSKPGTGIVWGTRPAANPDHVTVGGTLYAFDAVTLDELWDSEQNAARDSYGSWAKFVSPTVINGKVYVATNSQQVVVYGLLGQ